MVARSYRVNFKCAIDPVAYAGFNIVVTEYGKKPLENPIYSYFIKPPFNEAGTYYYEFIDVLIDNEKSYDVWIQVVSYGVDSMWRSLSNLEIPDDGIGTIGSDFKDITQEELDEGLAGKDINGDNTNIINIDGGNINDRTKYNSTLNQMQALNLRFNYKYSID